MRIPSGSSDRITRSLHIISAVALCTMMLIVVGDVVLRAVFNTPVKGAYDMVSIALLIMAMAGMAPVVASRGEILIDLIDGAVPGWAVRLLMLVSAVTGTVLFIFFGWAMIAPAMDAWQWGERSLELGIPKWPLWIVVFAGLIGIVWGYLLQLREVLAPGPAGRETGE